MLLISLGFSISLCFFSVLSVIVVGHAQADVQYGNAAAQYLQGNLVNCREITLRRSEEHFRSAAKSSRSS